MRAKTLLIAVASLTFYGCVATTDDPAFSAALGDDDGSALRSVTIRLSSQNPEVVDLSNRLIHASPIETTTRTVAQAEQRIGSVTATLVGDSCSTLRVQHPDLSNCTESQELFFQYGDIETSNLTDLAHNTLLNVGAGEYQITVESWRSDTDPSCGWSGAETLPADSVELEIPVIAFCE